MKIKMYDEFDQCEYINKLMNLDMALENLEGLFDVLSVAMTETELTDAESGIQRIYEFRNYIDKMMEGE